MKYETERDVLRVSGLVSELAPTLLWTVGRLLATFSSTGGKNLARACSSCESLSATPKRKNTRSSSSTLKKLS